MPDHPQLAGMPEPLVVPELDGMRFPNVELNLTGGVTLAIITEARSDAVADLEMGDLVDIAVKARLARKGFKPTQKGNIAVYTFEVEAVEEWDGDAIDEAARAREAVEA